MKKIQVDNLLFLESRELFKNEYANLSKKAYNGYGNADWFRRNMFRATSRSSRKSYEKNRVIWKSESHEISISHPLHQKHADVLSLLFSDNYGISKINRDGSFSIYTSLYYMAKKMGYKHPSSSAIKISKFIDDLRHTDFVLKELKKNRTTKFTILGKSEYNKERELYIVNIDGDSAKILTMSIGLKIEKELNQKIINIGDKHSKLKALIRYVVSNEPTSYGFTLTHIFEKFDIGQRGAKTTQRKEKSMFRRELRENHEILSEFNIIYSKAEEKIYWRKHKNIEFEKSISISQIEAKIKNRLQDIDREEGIHLIGKYIDIDNSYFKIIAITPVIDNRLVVDIKLENMKTKRVGISRGVTIKSIENLIIDD